MFVLQHDPELMACKDVDTDVFFPEGGVTTPEYRQKVAEAKAICNSCPLVAECLEYAVQNKDEQGIWGATTEAERKTMRNKRTKTIKV